MSTQLLFGVPVEAATLAEVVESVDVAIRSRKTMDIGVVNAAKVVNMHRSDELRKSVLSSSVIYADGMSVVWASRILGRPLPERVAGIDLMHAILEHGNTRSYRVFCLGARQEILDEVVRRFGESYPGVTIAGARNGYFTAEEEESVAEQIRDAKPDVLFVAITSPKKENFMARWSGVMQVPVVHGVGGSFDVVAGLVERAPESWQRLGLEWLYRVKQEPGRLWKRYLVTNSLFLGLIVREYFRGILAR
jgi:N-acetylglucosaminyldiphosphoundecaprenol N-acetyl-beta-D-mannosaminyltransferase